MHMIVIGLLALSGFAGRAQAPNAVPPPPPPPETLAGIAPGCTVGTAVHLHGPYDIVLPGRVSFLYSGDPGSQSYQWSIGNVLGRPGLSVETDIGSPQVDMVVVDRYPGLLTARGLGTLMPEYAAWQLYGMPDYAYQWQFDADNPVIELFYMNQGLVVILNQVPGRTNWTITKLVLTYPANLANAVALRTREAMSPRDYVQDITHSYRVWARMAVPSAG